MRSWMRMRSSFLPSAPALAQRSRRSSEITRRLISERAARRFHCRLPFWARIRPRVAAALRAVDSAAMRIALLSL